MYIITQEKSDKGNLEAKIIAKNEVIYIYRVDFAFNDCIIAENLRELWEIVEEIKNRLRI